MVGCGFGVSVGKFGVGSGLPSQEIALSFLALGLGPLEVGLCGHLGC